MNAEAKITIRLRRRFPPVALALVLAMLVAGCVTGQKAVRKDVAPAVTEAKPTTDLYRSDRYVVYRLKGDETPEILAGRFLDDPKRSWVVEEANPDIPFVQGQMIVIPLQDRARGGLRPDGYQLVPILCYHRFAEQCESRLCMPTAVFENQLNYLKENGYRTIGMADLLDFLNFRKSLPQKAVMITIDDGYRSGYDIAYPLLSKYGFVATFFIYTDFIGSTSLAVNWDMLKEMRSNGFDIASHTLSHCDLTKQKEGETDSAFSQRIEREIVESKKQIDAKLATDTFALAYPYGVYDARVLAITKRAGYKIGFSATRGGNPFCTDPLTLNRDQVLFQDMDQFITRLKTLEPLRLQ